MIAAWSRVWPEYSAEALLNSAMGLSATDIFLLLTSHGGAYYGSSAVTSRDLAGRIKEIASRSAEVGIRLHAWITPLRLGTLHRHLYVVNRLGASAYDSPPYVDNYKFLCPSRDDSLDLAVRALSEAAELAEFYGVHLGYLHYPELPLPPALAKKYGVAQYDPAYDYCYCDVCGVKFKAETGLDIREAPRGLFLSWRAKSLARYVSSLAAEARRLGFKAVSAHVHPDPQYAFEAAGQRWWTWGLDFYVITAYRSDWGGDLEWVRRVSTSSAQLGPVVIGLRASELAPGDLKALADLKGGNILGVSIFQVPIEVPQWLGKEIRLWA
ncbi:MAG: hypothetical protein JZD41_01770 [Thermoproteus sp.]|nr:hypothetical protein [Thermoproteus sp.]